MGQCADHCVGRRARGSRDSEGVARCGHVAALTWTAKDLKEEGRPRRRILRFDLRQAGLEGAARRGLAVVNRLVAAQSSHYGKFAGKMSRPIFSRIEGYWVFLNPEVRLARIKIISSSQSMSRPLVRVAGVTLLQGCDSPTKR